MFPYSADAPNEITSITSVSGQGQAPPLTGDVKSVPSSSHWFSLTPDPNADMPVSSPLVGDVAEIPGALLMKSNMLNRLSGVRSSSSVSMFVETPDRLVSTMGEAPETVTVSANAPTCSVTLRSTVPPTWTRMPSSSYLANPASSARNEYTPGGRLRNR